MECIFRLNSYTYQHWLSEVPIRSATVRFDPDPEQFAKNTHVEYKITENDETYEFMYQFRDQNKKDWTWRWSYPARVTDEMIGKFGIPHSIFEPYYAVDSVIKARNRIINDGMFMMEGNYVGPDLNAMINYYRPFMEPVSTLINNALVQNDSRRDRIEMAMKFTQDIPYSIPPIEQNDKYTGGIFPPPQVFVNMYGDCDSKVVLFAGILSHYNDFKMLILQETGHVLTAIEGLPKPYDKFYEYKNQKYIMAETAGPGRLDFGVIKDPYQKVDKAFPVNIKKN
jgi:hypothetical protein